ncbi:MAG: TIM barrel protein [Bacteroidales bacterium]|nr:TIM barrel protein [Bacteroidales bacterium]
MRTLRFAFALAAGVLALACNKKMDPDGDEDAAGIALELSVTGADASFDWSEVKEVSVNNRTYKVRMQSGKPVVSVTLNEAGSYTVIMPAKGWSRSSASMVLPLAQFPGEVSGRASASAMPMYGVSQVGPEGGKVQVSPLAGLLKVPVRNGGAVRSIRVRSIDDSKSLSGTYLFKNNQLTVLDEFPRQDWVVLNTGGAGEGRSFNTFFVAIPSGNYPQGFEIRVSNMDLKACTITVPAITIETGKVTEVPTVDFATSTDILYAEYFDNCVWGGDPVGGKMGYGPESGRDRMALLTDKGTEQAWYPKNPGTPGTDLIQSRNFYTPTWGLDEAMIGNFCFGGYQHLYYHYTYQGYIGGYPEDGHQDRPYITFSDRLNIPHPKTVNFSFKLCGETGFASDFIIREETGELLAAKIDGEPFDVDPWTSPNITMTGHQHYKLVTLKNSILADGKWHEISLRIGGFGCWTKLSLFADTQKGVKNSYYIDDIVIRAEDSAANRYVDSAETVYPTDKLGEAGADVSNLRLTPSFCSGCANAHIYSACPVNGMVYVCGGLPHEEEKWEEAVQNGLTYMAQWGNKAKLWSSHLPYGYRHLVGTERRDISSMTEQYRKEAVQFYKRAIEAIAPLHPVNVLVHCNQSLLNDGNSSKEQIAKSLAEISVFSDAIGAHLVVENMSDGVGAKASDLVWCVEQANAQAHPRYEIRICMDTGHANCYLAGKNEGTIVDWLKTAGTHVGHLHVHGNRGGKNVISGTNVTVYDDHIFPGYAGHCQDNRGTYYDNIGRNANNLWGQFYYHLLSTCRYRGPFNYEVSNYTFEAMGEERTDNNCNLWSVFYNYDNYIYPKYRTYIGH